VCEKDCLLNLKTTFLCVSYCTGKTEQHPAYIVGFAGKARLFRLACTVMLAACADTQSALRNVVLNVVSPSQVQELAPLSAEHGVREVRSGHICKFCMPSGAQVLAASGLVHGDKSLFLHLKLIFDALPYLQYRLSLRCAAGRGL